MPRNLDRRIETLVAIRNPTVRAQILDQVMAANLRAEEQSWLLQPDGRYIRYAELPEAEDRDDLFNCHEFFMRYPSPLRSRTRGEPTTHPDLRLGIESPVNLASAARAAHALPPPGTAPAARTRVGVIDIGSNSVRLVVFEAEGRAPYYLFNEKIMCGLGAKLDRTGRLSAEGRVPGAAGACGVSGRSAESSRSTPRSRSPPPPCGRHPTVTISFAKCSPIPACRSGSPAARRRPVTRPAACSSGRPTRRVWSQTWAAPPSSLPKCRQAVREHVPRFRSDRSGGPRTFGTFGPCASPLTRSCPNAPSWNGGNGASISSAVPGGRSRVSNINRTRYPLQILHEFTLSRLEARKLAKWASYQTLESLARFTDASESRLRVTPFGGLVLDRLIKFTRAKQVTLSAFGLREGILFEHLPTDRRLDDPLIAACAEFERRHARFPGYGTELFEWVRPLFPDSGPAELRLVRAACLANDVEWREHPDYRAAMAFEGMMRVDVAGVDHEERLFVALALLFRHKGARRAAARLDVFGLLENSRIERSERLGRAMRVADHFAGASAGVLPHCPLRPQDDTLVLAVPRRFAPLAGESVEGELSILGQLLGKPAQIDLLPELW